MIDRIAPSGPLASRDTSDRQVVGQPAAVARNLATGLQLGAPLRQMAAAAAQQLQFALGASPVSGAALERAVLDFGREAKAYRIGHPDQSADHQAARIDAAIEAGARHAAGLPETMTPIDRATLLFEQAAHHIAVHHEPDSQT